MPWGFAIGMAKQEHSEKLDFRSDVVWRELGMFDRQRYNIQTSINTDFPATGFL
jgi:hypothetical protein